MLCIVEEAGRLWVVGCSEQERGWVLRLDVESWLCLMHEVEVLRVPLLFGRAHADITLSEDGVLATKSAEDYDNTRRTTASKVVMRLGCHFVQFTVLAGSYVFFGVIRPGWDVEEGVNAFDVDGHSFYSTLSGRRGGNDNWEGMQGARVQGDRVGMLLDLDQGSMTVWENDVQLGVMAAEGLSGPLCWAVSMGMQGDSARIESAALPQL